MDSSSSASISLSPNSSGSLPIASDNLSSVREIMRAFPVLAEQLGVPESVRLVLDANVLVAEVRWIVKKRRNNNARTALQEALASGTLVGFAPTYLEEEMRRQLAALAEEEHLSYEALADAWTQYKVSLIFYDAGGPALLADSGIVDPKDLPYVRAYSALGAAAIMTADPHLRRMGALTVDAELCVKMRSYARDASIDFTLRLGGFAVGACAVAGAVGLAKIGVRLISGISKLPTAVRFLVYACLIGALLHRSTRHSLLSVSSDAGRRLGILIDDALPMIYELVAEAKQKRERATNAWSEIEPRFVGRRITLAAQALSVCAASPSSLHLDEIAHELRKTGARTSAPSFRNYLRRVLRTHPRLEQTRTGAWTVAPILAPSPKCEQITAPAD